MSWFRVSAWLDPPPPYQPVLHAADWSPTAGSREYKVSCTRLEPGCLWPELWLTHFQFKLPPAIYWQWNQKPKLVLGKEGMPGTLLQKQEWRGVYRRPGLCSGRADTGVPGSPHQQDGLPWRPAERGGVLGLEWRHAMAVRGVAPGGAQRGTGEHPGHELLQTVTRILEWWWGHTDKCGQRLHLWIL